ncbi:magnesium transporter MgtE N-terminal domain-containing protein [Alteriqipengyuania sp. 357]
MILKRPSLLMLMAGAAALSTFAHGVSASETSQEKPAAKAPASRLGSAIQSEMGEKKKSANERERELDLREKALKASEQRLKANLANQPERSARDQRAAAAAAARSDRESEQAETLDQLARIYQSMKPKQAAVVFEQLDIEVQIAVARKMRERSTANILAAMTPAAAARLSMALAGKPPARQPRPRPRTAAASQPR